RPATNAGNRSVERQSAPYCCTGNAGATPPSPTENNVTIGTARGSLVRSVGKPDLSVRTMQQEFLIETYVYEQQDRAIAGADAGRKRRFDADRTGATSPCIAVRI